MKRAVTNDEIELLLSFVREHIDFAEEMTGPNYGPYMGGDPHTFTPDPQDSTEEERERHKRACEAWERGERRQFPAGFGMGTTHDLAKDKRCRRLRQVPGADSPQVCYLRSQRDCRAIIAKAGQAKRVVLIGASFIAMEVASSLIHRKLQVDVVAPEAVPLERIVGPQVGEYLRRLHERNGVVFHLQQSVAAIGDVKVTLSWLVRVDGRR